MHTYLEIICQLRMVWRNCFDDTLFICFYSFHYFAWCTLYAVLLSNDEVSKIRCVTVSYRFEWRSYSFLMYENCAVKVDIRSVQGEKRAHDRFCTSFCTFVSYSLTFSLGHQGTYDRLLPLKSRIQQLTPSITHRFRKQRIPISIQNYRSFRNSPIRPFS